MKQSLAFALGAAILLLVSAGAVFFFKKPIPLVLETTPPEEVEESATVTFVGDIMLDRYIRAKNHDSGYTNVLSPDLVRYLNKSDLVVANLEGPITTNPSVARYDSAEPTHFQFTFDPAVTGLLKKANIGAVSLGNNHILNFGPYGLQETIEFLGVENIGYFGNPLDASNVWQTEIKGVSFAFVAENEFDQVSFETILATVRDLDSKHDHVIVIPHWGNEYELEPNVSQVEKAHALIDAGADLIVGAHPHVIQTKEEYQGKMIYYSLGNFIFDQYFSSDVRCGLVPTFKFTKDSIGLKGEINIHLLEDGTTGLAQC